jgi:CDP-glucose 4,6-dehydratase
MNFSNPPPNFWYKKRVFLTGHTGFKGSWLSLWLSSLGAKVVGYSLPPNTQPNLYELLNVGQLLEKSYFEDIRDFALLKTSIELASPEIVIHMAAQPLVRYSYMNPLETYSTNVMGTANLLEALRHIDSVRATVIVTTDKCYQNNEWLWGYRENEPMGGNDPYSSSKACAELVTAAFRHSYFLDESHDKPVNAIATARAGNVIGGGDWSSDRLMPDVMRAFQNNSQLLIRNPLAIRPWQHVLEPLSGYMLLAKKLYEFGSKFAGGWNFGPDQKDARSVQEVLEIVIKSWEKSLAWAIDEGSQPYEAHSLRLDCVKAHYSLGWKPRWVLEEAIDKLVKWHKSLINGDDMTKISLEQIYLYENSNQLHEGREQR